MKKKYFTGIVGLLAMLLLILDSQTVLRGAQDGVMLCLQTVIPSLFPFFFISGMVNRTLLGYSGKALSPIGRVCGIPSGAESLIILGLTGGYPVCAQAISSAYENGCIAKQDAERMLGFCNNAGPAFVFGMAASIFENKWIPWGLWGILIISALLTGMILPGKSKIVCRIPQNGINKPLEQALKAISIVCGWVILFRVLIFFLNRWFLWLLPTNWAAVLSGLLELTNGCIELHKSFTPAFQFVALAGLLSFGGFCVGLQTVSVAEKLSCKIYFFGKLLQTVISIVLSIIFCIVAFPGK